VSAQQNKGTSLANSSVGGERTEGATTREATSTAVLQRKAGPEKLSNPKTENYCGGMGGLGYEAVRPDPRKTKGALCKQWLRLLRALGRSKAKLGNPHDKFPRIFVIKSPKPGEGVVLGI